MGSIIGAVSSVVELNVPERSRFAKLKIRVKGEGNVAPIVSVVLLH